MIQSLTSNIIDIDRQAYKPSIIFSTDNIGVYTIFVNELIVFLKSNHNIESDNVDLLGQKYGKPFTSNGNMDQYNQLINFIESNDISLSENFSYIKSQIDINELLNYLILQIYSGNGDWPQNNYKLWKTQTGSEKWRWIIHDMDAGFGLSGDSSVTTIPCHGLFMNTQILY